MYWLDQGISVIDSEHDGMCRNCVEESVFVAEHPRWTDNGSAWESIFDSIFTQCFLPVYF